jgi:hypothetical protein
LYNNSRMKSSIPQQALPPILPPTAQTQPTAQTAQTASHIRRAKIQTLQKLRPQKRDIHIPSDSVTDYYKNENGINVDGESAFFGGY